MFTCDLPGFVFLITYLGGSNCSISNSSSHLSLWCWYFPISPFYVSFWFILIIRPIGTAGRYSVAQSHIHFFFFYNLKNKILTACRSSGCKVSWPLWKDWWSGSLVFSFDFQRIWSRYLKFLTTSTAAEVSLVMQKKKTCINVQIIWLSSLIAFVSTFLNFILNVTVKMSGLWKVWKVFWEECKNVAVTGGNMTIKCNRAVQVVCKDVLAKIIIVLVYRQETVNLWVFVLSTSEGSGLV